MVHLGQDLYLKMTQSLDLRSSPHADFSTPNLLPSFSRQIEPPHTSQVDFFFFFFFWDKEYNLLHNWTACLGNTNFSFPSLYFLLPFFLVPILSPTVGS